MAPLRRRDRPARGDLRSGRADLLLAAGGRQTLQIERVEVDRVDEQRRKRAAANRVPAMICRANGNNSRGPSIITTG